MSFIILIYRGVYLKLRDPALKSKHSLIIWKSCTKDSDVVCHFTFGCFKSYLPTSISGLKISIPTFTEQFQLSSTSPTMHSNQSPAHVHTAHPCLPPTRLPLTKQSLPLSICWTASFPIWAAVKPCSDTSEASAPYPSNSLQVWRWPASAARCSAVWPRVSRAFTYKHKYFNVMIAFMHWIKIPLFSPQVSVWVIYIKKHKSLSHKSVW